MRLPSLNAVLVFDSGSNEYINFTFEPSISGKQYNTAIIKASEANSGKILKSMRVRLVYYKNANTAYFDNISLNIDETGTSYTYDGNGNVISAIDNAQNNQTYTYNSANELIKANYQDNTSYEYTYDTTYKHRLLSAKSVNSNINISYAYNNKGFVTSTTVTGGNKSIVTSNTYSGTNSNFLASETDALGNTTSYTYDAARGTLSTVKDSAETVTNYVYNEDNDYLEGIFVTGSSSSGVTYNYGATNRALNSITTNTCVYNFTYDKFMNVSKVSVGSQELTRNEYASNNGNLIKSTYGNKDYVVYSYDDLDRVTSSTYNDFDKGTSIDYSWKYNAANQVSALTDSSEGRTYNYIYDLSGRLIEMNRDDGAYIRTDYDTKNLSTGIEYSFGGVKETFGYTYNESKDNAPSNTVFSDGTESRIEYDALGRKNKDALYKNDTLFFKATYSFLNNASDSSKTSGLVSKIDYDLGSIEDLEYSYDSRGNITQIKKGGNLLESYTYDKLNRLIRVDSSLQGKTIQYEYDRSGNITSKKEYPYNNTTSATIIISYAYDDSNWKDKLTAYDGKAITYDAIGNPLSYNGKTFTWLGRRLNTYKSGSTTTSYTYNADGIRTSKTVGSAKTEYFLNGSQILAQKTGNNVIPFYYDANGTRIAFKYNGTMYYYVYNLQGDVTHLIDVNKNIVGTYQYDAWGKILNLGSLTAIAQANPFRYRGYYYDTESGLYYLNSRYYNAEWGRFINADGELSGVGGDIRGYNLFAYCMNNPVNLSDEAGNWPKWLSGAINTVSGTLQMVTGAALGATVGWTGIGAVAAGFLMVNGAATAAQGIGQIVNHVTNTNTFREDNIVRTGVQSAGAAIGGNTGAAVAGGLYDAAVMTANMYAGIKISTPSACFVAGTVVLTELGNKVIEEIEIGDFVWAENPETGKKSLKKVVQTFVRESNELVYVYVNGEEIVTTPEHPFFVPNQGWTASIQLRAGDILVLQNGKYVVIEKIQHEILESPIKVYNFEVADFHTYYVGNNGVLVHNTCKPVSPVKVNKNALKDIDVHLFKEEIVGKQNVSKFDVFKDTSNNSILWLGNKAQNKWIETGYYIDELIKIFPK